MALKQHIIKGFESLPVSKIANTINERLATQHTLVVTAPPGAGKSTLLPLSILESLEGEGKILMLEPRRIAARQIAERMSYMIDEPVGKTVGYRIRFENKVSSETRIEVLTEGILSQMIISDPTLDGVRAIIFDEFHERSLACDEALALACETQQIIRPDLRIVVMSATIETTAICKHLNAELIESEGRQFPVEIIHAITEPVMDTTSEIAEAVAHYIKTTHDQYQGDILAFLPGEAEIRKCQDLLQGKLGGTRILPLYGMLSPTEQHLAIQASKDGERKVVLSTPIAETSLTIEGVRIVIDSGLYRKVEYNSQSGLSHLRTHRISRDMADQRAGRAGRVAPGICMRLWSKATELRMEASRMPEILDADLASLTLDIAAWGETPLSQMKWLTTPPSARVAQAEKLLTALKAIDDRKKITAHGRRIASMPCHPRIAQMLCMAENDEQKALAADVAAILEEKDPMASDTEIGSDINYRIEELRHIRSIKQLNKRWERICKNAEHYNKLTHTKTNNDAYDHYDTGLLIAAAFPERIACCINTGQCLYRLANGEQAKVEQSDEITSYSWIAIANINLPKNQTGRIFLSAPVRHTDLAKISQSKENISWDSKKGEVSATMESRIGCLLLDSKPLCDTNRERINEIICKAAQKDGISMLDFNEKVQNLQRRISLVSEWHPELNLPDLSTDTILTKAPEWLPFYLNNAITASDLKRIDLTNALWGMLTYEQQMEVDRIAPTHITVPTGSRIKIEYRQGAEQPIVKVRLQECFGMTETPRIDKNRRNVLLELLSPGFKPVQITQDLISFWDNAYFEVRKELRRRYPKHYWPENPLEAEAVKGVKKG